MVAVFFPLKLLALRIVMNRGLGSTMKRHRKRILSCGVAAAAVVLAQAAIAGDFTIVNGQVVTTTQVLDTPGDVGTVEAGGTVNVPAGNGIEAGVDGVTITNAGDVTAGGIYGIVAGNANSITNTGTVTGGNYGIVALSSNTISNAGAATGGNYGINAVDYNTITNTGTAMGGDIGISALNTNTITNTGTATGGNYGINAIDANTINNVGTATGGIYGIYANASNIISNSGTATGAAVGIATIDSNNNITNTGTATGGSYGLYVTNANTMNNAGTATGGTYGIAAGNSNTISNTGTVTGGAVAIRASTGNTITNTGNATGQFGGMYLDNSNIISNSGTASGTAPGSYGILANSFNTISNTGTVSGKATGIIASNANTITNTGTIAGSTAVRFSGTGNTLALLAGSNIQGNLDLGAGNTLTIGSGLNTALAYTGTPTINTGGLPSLVTGGVVYVVDPTGFSAADGMVTDLTGIVTDAVGERLATARNGAGAGTVAWFKALGGYRDQQAGGIDVGFETLLGGVVTGVDTSMGDGRRGGLFIGAAAGRARTSTDSQAIDSGNYFAGAYAGFTGGNTFLDLSLTAGLSDVSSDRRVANNQVAGGIEHAQADYRGFFISPSVTLGSAIPMGNGGILTPSVRARYAGLFLNSYDETGSAADLGVAGRDVSVFEVRGQLAYGFAPWQRENGVLDTTLRLGADGIASNGGGIQASLGGAPLDVSGVDTSGETIRGFVGFDTRFTTTGGARVHVGTELGYDSNEAFTARAQAGFEIPF
jgi:hypothetical protein